MDWTTRNIEVYNKSAITLTRYFKGIGPRVADIKRALELADAKSGTHVIEIGCGDGRDALEIIKHVAWYQGCDPSVGMLKAAKKTAPQASFVLADGLTYAYPSGLDVVYAFASLLHVNKVDFARICQKINTSLRPDGIFYISLKERDRYSKEVKKDMHGERMFYYYTPSLVQTISGKNFTSVYEDHQTIGHTNWFTLALQKSS
jgi:SAM-dependent methyltransferase